MLCSFSVNVNVPRVLMMCMFLCAGCKVQAQPWRSCWSLLRSRTTWQLEFMNLPKSWMCKYCRSWNVFALDLSFFLTHEDKGTDFWQPPLLFPTVTQTAWHSASSPPTRSTSAISLFRSTSPSSRLSASITTSTWCASTTSSAWPTSWVQTKAASPRTRIAFLSRYVPTQSGTGSRGESCMHHSSVWFIFLHTLPSQCACRLSHHVRCRFFLNMSSPLHFLFRVPVQTRGKTLLWTSWVCSARRAAVCTTGCPPSHSQNAEVTTPLYASHDDGEDDEKKVKGADEPSAEGVKPLSGLTFLD